MDQTQFLSFIKRSFRTYQKKIGCFLFFLVLVQVLLTMLSAFFVLCLTDLETINLWKRLVIQIAYHSIAALFLVYIPVRKRVIDALCPALPDTCEKNRKNVRCNRNLFLVSLTGSAAYYLFLCALWSVNIHAKRVLFLLSVLAYAALLPIYAFAAYFVLTAGMSAGEACRASFRLFRQDFIKKALFSLVIAAFMLIFSFFLNLMGNALAGMLAAALTPALSSLWIDCVTIPVITVCRRLYLPVEYAMYVQFAQFCQKEEQPE